MLRGVIRPQTMDALSLERCCVVWSNHLLAMSEARKSNQLLHVFKEGQGARPNYWCRWRADEHGPKADPGHGLSRGESARPVPNEYNRAGWPPSVL